MTERRQKLGLAGERLAEDFLVARGFTVLDRRYRVLRAEIDLICADGEMIVFVEVKTRRSARFGHPILSITERKLLQIAKAAEIWLRKRGSPRAFHRYDIVTIMWSRGNPVIEHWKAVG